MPTWRYRAIPLHSVLTTAMPEVSSGRPAGAAAAVQRGEISAASAVEARAALRAIGLLAVEMTGGRERSSMTVALPGAPAWASYLRRRRSAVRADLFDSLATMLDSGLPLVEAVDALTRSIGEGRGWVRRSSLRSMLIELREALRSGQSPAEAAQRHTSWFDAADIALLRAGLEGGSLPQTLRAMASREESNEELSHRMVAALSYPTLIVCAALGVTVFLSVKTLPTLVGILTDAGIEPPGLTLAVMNIGIMLADWWGLILLGVIFLPAAIVILRQVAVRRENLDRDLFGGTERLPPAFLRRHAVGSFSLRLAQLLQAGVPLVESLRILAPTCRLAALGRQLHSVADVVERGAEFGDALEASPYWFDAEFTLQVQTAQRAGALEAVLVRLGNRELRRTQRLLDRFTALLEPAAILLLAGLVGTIVMAGVLPLIRLQEML